MIFVWALLIAAAVGNAHGAALDSTTHNASRIVGGALTTIDRYPSLVQVEFRYNFLFWYQVCAGVILTPKYTLSVAQCFTGFLFSIAQRRIRAGSSYRNTGGVIGVINKAYNHPNYGKSADYDSDLTILELNSELTYTHTISPALLAAHGFEMFDNLPVIHVGWGKTRIGGGGDESEQVQDVTLYTINHELCTARYAALSRSPQVTTNMICSGILNTSSKDTCEGDEGGPMMFNSDILVGVTSWRYDCADATYPSVSTKISAFTNWIYEAIAV